MSGRQPKSKGRRGKKASGAKGAKGTKGSTKGKLPETTTAPASTAKAKDEETNGGPPHSAEEAPSPVADDDMDDDQAEVEEEMDTGDDEADDPSSRTSSQPSSPSLSSFVPPIDGHKIGSATAKITVSRSTPRRQKKSRKGTSGRGVSHMGAKAAVETSEVFDAVPPTLKASQTDRIIAPPATVDGDNDSDYSLSDDSDVEDAEDGQQSAASPSKPPHHPPPAVAAPASTSPSPTGSGSEPSSPRKSDRGRRVRRESLKGLNSKIRRHHHQHEPSSSHDSSSNGSSSYSSHDVTQPVAPAMMSAALKHDGDTHESYMQRAMETVILSMGEIRDAIGVTREAVRVARQESRKDRAVLKALIQYTQETRSILLEELSEARAERKKQTALFAKVLEMESRKRMSDKARFIKGVSAFSRQFLT